jgi:hypothetical protein
MKAGLILIPISAIQDPLSAENNPSIAHFPSLYDFVTYSIVFCYERRRVFASLLMFAASMIRCSGRRSQNKSVIYSASGKNFFKMCATDYRYRLQIRQCNILATSR